MVLCKLRKLKIESNARGLLDWAETTPLKLSIDIILPISVSIEHEH